MRIEAHVNPAEEAKKDLVANCQACLLRPMPDVMTIRHVIAVKAVLYAALSIFMLTLPLRRSLDEFGFYFSAGFGLFAALVAYAHVRRFRASTGPKISGA